MPAKVPIYLKSSYSKKGKKCRLRDILSPDMISPPLGDFRHTIHIGKGGVCDAFGDMSFLEGKFELLPGKGGLLRHGEFTRANSASDACYVEAPSPVLKNAISLPTFGSSQALTLPPISTTGFPLIQDSKPEPETSDTMEDLEMLNMENLLQSISVFRSDLGPLEDETDPINQTEMPEKPLVGYEHEQKGFVSKDGVTTSFTDHGNQTDGDSLLDFKQELFSIKGDWADRDSGVEEGRLCDSDFEISKSKSHSQESVTYMPGSLFSLELDLGPSILDDILDVMNKPVS